ncbi:MAG: hypothetical protein MUF64_19810 [Polyangiaceae bacterium]|jgi:serine/threonine-protein kinase|nr:hypothetical protein [Polyangiaceae bacterium]
MSSLSARSLSLLLALSTFSSHAAGQSPEAKAQAEVLFEEGVKKLGSKEIDAACKALEMSQKLDPGIGTLLYLADCYEQQGKLASAWATFREAASLAKAANQGKREATALRRASELSPRVPRITLLPPSGDSPELTATRNGAPIARELWGRPMPIDPGLHTFEVTGPGKKAVRIELTIKQGEEPQSLQLPTPEPLPRAASSAPPPATSAPPPDPPASAPPLAPPPSGAQKTAGLVLAGVGVLGVGLGSYLGLQARSDSKEADRLCNPADRTRCNADAARLGNDARSTANIATVVFTSGGALLLGGALLYLLAPSTAPSSGRTHLIPAVGPSHAGLSLGGTF